MPLNPEAFSGVVRVWDGPRAIPGLRIEIWGSEVQILSPQPFSSIHSTLKTNSKTEPTRVKA